METKTWPASASRPGHSSSSLSSSDTSTAAKTASSPVGDSQDGSRQEDGGLRRRICGGNELHRSK